MSHSSTAHRPARVPAAVYAPGLLRVRAYPTAAPSIVARAAVPGRTTKTITSTTAAAKAALTSSRGASRTHQHGAAPRGSLSTSSKPARSSGPSTLGVPKPMPGSNPRSREPQPRPPENPHVKMPWDFAPTADESKLNFYMGVPDAYPVKRPKGNY